VFFLLGSVLIGGLLMHRPACGEHGTRIGEGKESHWRDRLML